MIERMMDSFIGFCAVLVLAGACLAAGIGSIVFLYDFTVEKPSCISYGAASNQSVLWTLGTGCIVKYDGEWVDFSVATKKKQEIVVRQKQ